MPLQGHIRDNNYGPGIGDRRHIVTANFVWDLPFFRQQQGIAVHVFGGWEVWGIQTFQTGLPATVSSNQSIDPTGADCLGPSPCSFRANQVGDPNANAPNSYEVWFNAAAFTNPVAGQTTNPPEPPGALRLPGLLRAELPLFKNIRFSERLHGQVTVGKMNTFKHPRPDFFPGLTNSNPNR